MRQGSLVIGALCAWSAVSVQAEVKDPFHQGDVVDGLAIARVADEAGDDALSARLSDPARRDAALIAARAAAFAHAPERLIPRLVALANGRDPALSPEAALSMLAIAERLTPSELARREVLLSDLQSARVSVSAAAVEPAPRADIAFALAQLDAALKALGAPAAKAD